MEKACMKLQYFAAVLLIIAFTFSCKKDNGLNEEAFYGKWKTSYGDTISFVKENGKNILIYNVSLNASLPTNVKKEFIYKNHKLGLKEGWNGDDFQVLQTFTWKKPGKSFEVQGIEWFGFLSSTQTYFTFTKIE
jgi:uncharacterized protein (DUF2147 family)